MPEFKTMWTPRNRKKYQQNHNQKVYYTYLETHDEKTGERKLVKDKKVDIYEKIQLYKEETNIKTLIERMDLKKQIERIKEEDQVISLVGVPENLMEMLNIISKQKQTWNAQTKEFKQNFGNSFEKYIAASETGELYEYLTKNGKKAKEQTAQETMLQAMPQAVAAMYTQPTVQQTVQPTIQQTAQTTIQQTQEQTKGINLNG